MHERYISWLSLTHPPLGTWPATQACALTGNWTGDLLFHRLAVNPRSHTSQSRPRGFPTKIHNWLNMTSLQINNDNNNNSHYFILCIAWGLENIAKLSSDIPSLTLVKSLVSGKATELGQHFQVSLAASCGQVTRHRSLQSEQKYKHLPTSCPGGHGGTTCPWSSPSWLGQDRDMMVSVIISINTRGTWVPNIMEPPN